MAFSKGFAGSNPSKKEAVLEWLFTNIDYGQIKRGYPVCFFRNTSFYLSELPSIKHGPPELRMLVLDAVVDKDMQEDLQSTGLINWCRNVSSVVPVKVPKDGNCLLHSITTAVWGILDDTLLFRRLLNVVLTTDSGGRFHSRWLRYRQQQISQIVGRILDSSTESLHQEWSEVSGCLDPERSASVAVPHRFLESIHVYTLANILRRPIIILTDSSVRAFSGLSLQDNDMGGIYLPLEWDWGNTSHTPVLLAYAQNHFCPLLFLAQSDSLSSPSRSRKNLTPLVTGKLEQLPVRFLLEGEEPEVGELLKKYLRVKETVMTLDGRLHNILCAEFETASLPEDLNLVAEFFRNMNGQYQQNAGLTGAQNYSRLGTLHQAEVVSQMKTATANFENLQGAGNQNQLASSPYHVRSEPMPGALAETAYMQYNPTMMRQVSVPLDIPPPTLAPPHRYLQTHGQKASLNPPLNKKCIVPNCKFYGDPSLGMMCSNCFKQYTITESRCVTAALAYERQQPTAPLPSIGAEEEEQYAMSMMTERCQKGCGYRCSRQTYPFCHECAEKLRREAQAKARAEERFEVARAGGEAAAASSAATVEISSASAPALPSSTAAAAVTHTSATGNPILEPSVAALATTPGTGANAPQQEDFIQCTSMAGGSSQAPLSPPVTSPTQVLNRVRLTPPLTPPDDTNDQELFGTGSPPPPASPPICTITTPTTNTQASQNQIGPTETLVTINNLSENRQTPPASAETCMTEGCTEEVVQQNRCGRCYIAMGLEPSRAQKLMQMTAGPNSITSATGHSSVHPKSHLMHSKGVESLVHPQSAGQPAPRPPSATPPLNATSNYVQNWLQKGGPQTGSQSLGLPERQGGDELGENDLLASGEACHTSAIKCVSPVCSNHVPQPGQLCPSCRNILTQSAKQSRATAGSVQESLPGGRQKCLEENCPYFGAQQTSGYCSHHYSKLFKRQLAEETRELHPANVAHPVPLAHNQRFVNMSPELRPIMVPGNRMGTKCVMPGCTFFGDPKQKNMCGKHYQEHISSIASASNVRVTFPNTTTPGYVHVTPQSATIVKPPTPGGVIFGTPETGGVTYVQGAVSVPPPSFPIAESGSPGSSVVGQVAVGVSQSLDETYTRVATRNVKNCINPGCSNFGNSSKGGLCNSCFENSELVRQAILGEEGCG